MILLALYLFGQIEGKKFREGAGGKQFLPSDVTTKVSKFTNYLP